MELSIGVEWARISEWQKYLLFDHKIVYFMEWSLGAEYWSGVGSDFGVAQAEWSAVVMSVCGQVLCNLVVVRDQ